MKSLNIVFIVSVFCLSLIPNLAFGEELTPREIVESRARQQSLGNDLYLLYGNYINWSATCLQSALSNYVEDKWDKVARENNCLDDNNFCNKHPNVRSKWEDWIKRQDVSVEDRRDINKKYNAYEIQADLFPPMQFSFSGDPPNRTGRVKNGIFIVDGKVYKDTASEEEHNDIWKYLSSCSTLAPLPWVVVGANYNSNNLTADKAKIEAYYKLYTYTFFDSLSDDKISEVVQCLTPLNQLIAAGRFKSCHDDRLCIENVAEGGKEDLLQLLDEFKEHKCSTDYGVQISAHLYPFQAPSEMDMKTWLVGRFKMLADKGALYDPNTVSNVLRKKITKTYQMMTSELFYKFTSSLWNHEVFDGVPVVDPVLDEALSAPPDNSLWYSITGRNELPDGSRKKEASLRFYGIQKNFCMNEDELRKDIPDLKESYAGHIPTLKTLYYQGLSNALFDTRVEFSFPLDGGCLIAADISQRDK